jgi:hypothetical protein
MKLLKGYTNVRFGESKANPLRKMRANILLGSFTGESTDIYRAVHFLRDNVFFFEDYSMEFFYRTHQLLRQKKLMEIKRILVYSGNEELENELSRRIIRFHAQNKGYAYRLVNTNDYSSLRQEYRLHPSIDFGVFGEKRVYRARTDWPDLVFGTWSSKKEEVRKYINFFEACWNSRFALRKQELEGGPRISLDELFAEPGNGEKA